MVTSIKRILQFLIFLGLGIGIMALVFNSQNAAFQEQCALDGIPSNECSLLKKLWDDFTSVSMVWMLLVAVAFTMSNLLRALRWQMLLHPMGYRPSLANSFLPILLGYFANLGFPRLGELMRASAMTRYEQIPLEKVFGTLVIDRLMDVLCLLIVLGLAFAFEADTIWSFIHQHRQTSISQEPDAQFPQVLRVAAALAILSAGILWTLRGRIRQNSFVQKVQGMLFGFADGLRSVFRMSSPGIFILYSIGIWLMFYLQAFFNLKAFGPTSSLDGQAALMVFVFGTLGFLIPSPGGMGTYHALCIAALALYGIRGNDAFSYANISFFAVQIFYNIAGGLLALILLPIINKKNTPA